MRIIFITSKLNFETSGGSVADLDLKARELQKLSNSVAVVTAYSTENKINKDLPYRVIEELIPSKKLITIQTGALHLLRKYEKEADVFHIDGHMFLYGGGLYKLLGGCVPIIAHFNRELMCWPDNVSIHLKNYKKPMLSRIKKRGRLLIEKYLGLPLANQLDFFTFANPILQKTYEEFGLKTAGKNYVAGDFIDHEQMRQNNGTNANTYLTRNKPAGGIITVYYTGRMVPGKGFDTLITAFSRIKNKNKYQLVLGGRGPEEPALRDMAAKLKINDFVTFTGWLPIENVYDYYKKADIFVLPKCMRLDFNSITLLEAMNFGLPCIVPAGGALAWGAGGGALHYIDEDCDDLARKIEKLGKDPGLREQLSKNCHIRLNDSEMDFRKRAREISAITKNIVSTNDQ